MRTRYLLFIIIFMSGCGGVDISSSSSISVVDRSEKIAIYAMSNYTDTPRAGMRAANIAEGILLSNGYQVVDRIDSNSRKLTLDEKLSDASQRGIRYIFVGGVSEWRYKTGIDGEPAISLQFKIIDTSTKAVKWSAVASDSSWGNDSIGTVAQELIASMIKK
ncbi:Extracellular Matrix protein PelC [hydrothermal vent metagenome]|uniref:Extracellular Matrix protein PelC n=1 Tax=hydrothermal vent metagenome TaxID=652676 RepID=A0A1W1BK04_9ZZZZ